MQVTNRLLFLILASFAMCVFAQPRESVEGIHYQAIAKPVPTETPEDVIEVREVFWYGCPECFTLNPMMTTYKNQVHGDVNMVRMPAVWNDLMALHARLYYTALFLDVENRIHEAAYRAIHEQNNPLRNEEQIRALFEANNVSAADFDAAWNSGEVSASVQQARLRTQDYGIDKLPAYIVNGRYRVVENAEVSNHIELNIAVNMVIRRLRDERRTDI